MMLSRPIKAIATAAVLITSAAPAAAETETTQPISLDQLFTAWKTICYANLKDSAAQIRAATSAPFSMVEEASERDGNRQFKSAEYIVWIEDAPDHHYCGVASNLSAVPTLDAGERLVTPLAGAPTERASDRVFWQKDTPDYALSIGFAFGKNPEGVPGALFGSGIDMK